MKMVRTNGNLEMKKLVSGIVSVVVVLCGLFIAAGRHVGELRGYFHASADKTVDGLVSSLPKEVIERKLDHDLRQQRRELIDQQVQLNLSRNQISELRSDVEKLETNVTQRKRLLSEAYPILKAAIDGGQETVKFANTDYTLSNFQREVDELLTLQDRETRQMEIKQQGLDRLERGEKEGLQALADMRSALENTEMEVEVLKHRREQAEMESKTLDTVAAITSKRPDVESSVSQGLNKIRGDVKQLEARNEARRVLSPVNERPTNQLTKHWNRLETLKAIHDEATPATTPESNPATTAGETRSLEADKVVIEIQSKK
jgi:chromosome segregation ATPase